MSKQSESKSLLFLSTHGDSSMELAMLAQQTGVRLVLPGPATQEALGHLVTVESIDYLKRYDIETIDRLNVMVEAVRSGRISAVMIGAPSQLPLVRTHFGECALVWLHTVNAPGMERKVANIISPSEIALWELAPSNSYVYKKIRDFDMYDQLVRDCELPVDQRHGFYSYIHHYRAYWPRAYAMFEAIKATTDDNNRVENFGNDSASGPVDCVNLMLSSKATIHIKDGHVCCNAPITSICLGRPVLMDRQTHSLLRFQDYIVHMESGILFDTPSEGAKWIKRLEEDDALLDTLTIRTYEFARRKCRNTADDLNRFRRFLDDTR